MSQTATRLPLPVAEQLAAKIVQSIEGACERVAIAGSIRRRAKLIGDVDLVAIPKASADLFGQPDGQDTELDRRLSELVNARKLTPVTAGPKSKTYKVGAWEGTKLNLYVVTPETWAVQLMIRTGPVEFSHRFVTRRRKRGLLPDTMRIYQGRLYRAANGGEAYAARLDGHARYVLLPTPSERDLFEQTELAWIEPEHRCRWARWTKPPQKGDKP